MIRKISILRLSGGWRGVCEQKGGRAQTKSPAWFMLVFDSKQPFPTLLLFYACWSFK